MRCAALAAKIFAGFLNYSADAHLIKSACRFKPDESETAKRKVRETYYGPYGVQVCQLIRKAKFNRNAPGAAAE